MTFTRLLARFAFACAVALPLLPLAAAAPVRAAGATAWPHDPQVVVRDILAQPDYRTAPRTSAEKPKPSLWDEFVTWLKGVFDSLLGPVARAVRATSGAGAVAGIALTVAALAGLVFVLVRLAMAFAAPDVRRRGSYSGRALAERRSSSEWRAAAADFAAKGEFARAIAALFSAALAELDERGLVALDPSRTPGEYRRLVRRARAEASPPFDDLASGFVRAAYSGVPAQLADFENAERALAGFEPHVVTP